MNICRAIYICVELHLELYVGLEDELHAELFMLSLRFAREAGKQGKQADRQAGIQDRREESVAPYAGTAQQRQ